MLDANVFVSALIRPEGPPGQIVARLLRDRAFELIASPPVLDELRRSLRYPRLRRYLLASEEELDLWVDSLRLVADVVEGSSRVHVVAADPDDDKYLAAAIEGLAQFVVTGDRHLLSLGRYEDVRIVTPRSFLQILDLEARSGEP